MIAIENKDTSLFWPLCALLLMPGGKDQSQAARSKKYHGSFHQYGPILETLFTPSLYYKEKKTESTASLS